MFRSKGIRAGITTAMVGGAIAAVTVGAVAAGGPAGAVPASQSICNTGSITIAPVNGFVPLLPARSVSVSAATTVKAQVVADVGVDAGAELRLGWSVNNGTVFEGAFGPANFANHAEFFESRGTFALINVPAGTTTIQPWLRISGAADKRGTYRHRCLTLEASTS